VAEVRAATAHLRPCPLVIAAWDTTDAGDADMLLLDARAPGAYGGTGRTLDWAALAREPGTPRDKLVLAGGLTPANVGAAIAALHPLVVDVSSGIESAPGHKDPVLLREFFTAVIHADKTTGRASAHRGRTGR
jgi:phosphoribosylanthranilate isomerase